MKHIDIEQFRFGMQRLAAGVCLVTTEFADLRAGLTATAVCSLSAEPPRLLVSINRSGRTYGLVAASRILAVSVLADDQVDLARAFAKPASAHGDNPFLSGAWDKMSTGAPLLHNALANFDCRVSSIIDTGSHAIVIADIVGAQAEESLAPLLYVGGHFATLGETM